MVNYCFGYSFVYIICPLCVPQSIWDTKKKKKTVENVIAEGKAKITARKIQFISKTMTLRLFPKCDLRCRT